MSIIGTLFKVVLSWKLRRDPEIIALAEDAKKTRKQVKNNFDEKIERGELKDTPALRRLRKELGVD